MVRIEIDQKYIRDVVSPNWERVLAPLALAAILLASPSAYLVTNHLTARIIAQETDSIIHHVLHSAGRYQVVNTFVIVLFWGSIAFLAYLCYWIIANAFTKTYNEVEIDTKYANIGSWQDRLAAPITRIICGMALIVFLLISWVIYGKCLVPFTTSLVHWQPRHLITEGLLVLGLAFNFYLIRILTVLVFSIE